MVLADLGNLCNLTALSMNGMRMPVVGYYVRPGLIWVTGYDARLPWLCDRFSMGDYVYSLGDFIIGAGILVTTAYVVTHIMGRIYARD